ncbi:MAG: GNAT family N-acetyltransferase [Bacteroidia bacterium]
MLKLEPIPINEDKSKAIYSSDDCQTLLKMWEDYYPVIGFNLPWVGYFVKRDDKIVGCCAFTGVPKDKCVEVSYWTFKEFEGQGDLYFFVQKFNRNCKAGKSFFNYKGQNGSRK